MNRFLLRIKCVCSCRFVCALHFKYQFWNCVSLFYLLHYIHAYKHTSSTINGLPLEFGGIPAELCKTNQFSQDFYWLKNERFNIILLLLLFIILCASYKWDKMEECEKLKRKKKHERTRASANTMHYISSFYCFRCCCSSVVVVLFYVHHNSIGRTKCPCVMIYVRDVKWQNMAYKKQQTNKQTHTHSQNKKRLNRFYIVFIYHDFLPHRFSALFLNATKQVKWIKVRMEGKQSQCKQAYDTSHSRDLLLCVKFVEL